MELGEDTAAAHGMPSFATPGAVASNSRRKTIRLAGRKPPPSPPQTRWRSITQEKIYSRRLLEALRSTATAASMAGLQLSSSSRAVKEAADSALALTAQGRTRWSRAILKRRWRMRKQPPLLRKAGRGKGRSGKGRCGSPAGGGDRKQREMALVKGKSIKVRARLRVLSRLVPGCRKASTPRLLEEAADYVAALELQVKAMRALADAYSSAASSSFPSSSSSTAAAAAAAAPANI